MHAAPQGMKCFGNHGQERQFPRPADRYDASNGAVVQHLNDESVIPFEYNFARWT
jgi:hypothetical protein